MPGRRPHVSGLMGLLGAFVAAAVTMGVLSAGLLLPVVGATGAAARTGVDMFDSLPSEFTTTPLSEQSKILAADGSEIATPYDENRIIVPLGQVAPVMRTAQIAIEDHRFYEHGGVDLQGILRAFISNRSAGEVTAGGSTLTQQYVKITLQENALRAGDTSTAKAVTAQSYARKIQELKYAIQLEKTYTKDQILEGYLNLVYYGDRAYGVEAASRHYFNKSAKDLTLSDAALLAGLAQNPGTTDPVNNPDKALARRNVVLDRMHDLKLVSDQDWQQAKAVKLSDILHPTPAKNSCQNSKYPYVCDYVIAWLKQDPSLDAALGKTDKERNDAIYRGGLTIQTTIDPATMDLARAELTKRVPVGNDADLGAASAVLDAKTGGVKAIVQNTDYKVNPNDTGQTTVNWAVDTKYGASLGFGFGSTIKAFALVTALENGIPANTTVQVKGASPSSPAVYSGRELPGACGLGRTTWRVRNDEGVGDGSMTLTQATARSINTAFVGLAIKIGDVCKIQETEYRMGLHQSNGEKIQGWPAAILLGANSVSPMTVASAYQTLANEGKHCEPVPVSTISKGGQPLPVPALGSRCEQRVDPDIARGVTDILTNVLKGEGTARASALADGRPAAGKTGTTDGNNETWFVGFTPELATAVWVGTPDDKNNSRVLDNVRVGGQSYRVVFGASIAAPTWKAIMDRALAGKPATPFTAPGAGPSEAAPAVSEGEVLAVPAVSRSTLDDARATVEQAGFTTAVRQQYSSSRAGTVIATSPSRQAPRGSVVTLVVSRGPAPARAPAAPAPAEPAPGAPDSAPAPEPAPAAPAAAAAPAEGPAP